MPSLNNATREELKVLWKALFRADPPTEKQWDVWAIFHDVDTIREGMLQLAIKDKKMAGDMSADYHIKFASAVMNRLSKEKRDALAQLAIRDAAIAAGVHINDGNGDATTVRVAVAGDDARDKRGNR
jgi:hypothetical protein